MKFRLNSFITCMKCMQYPMYVLAMLFLVSFKSLGQGSIFTSFKNDLKKADEHYQNKEYYAALDLYQDLGDKRKGGKDIDLKLARTQYFIGDYKNAEKSFKKYLSKSERLPIEDILKYADVLSAVADYETSIVWYERYSKIYPEDDLIKRKIWQLNNLNPLYEDSSYYVIKPLEVNSAFSELCAVPGFNGLVFLSDRKDSEGSKRNKTAENDTYFKLYHSTIKRDFSGSISTQVMTEPKLFLPDLKSDYHQGPLAFYDDGEKIVFSATSDKNNSNKPKTLHLFFAEEVNGNWVITSEFPYNSEDYSVSDPAISNDGMTIYFSSDMQEGFGGKDLYKSEMRNGIWSQPVNLGPALNTYRDESFPFIMGNELYFSSNGHAGLGGLDIYKAPLDATDIEEIQNLGYPINTNHDDFGLYMSEDKKQGYFSSNRSGRYYNDDMYVFKTNTQNFPVMINGYLKYKDQSSTGSDDLKILPNTDLFLIDHTRNVTVHESSSDSSGHFSIEVPYFSKYKIKVVEESGNTSIVNLDILEHQKIEKLHEIIVVRDSITN